MNNPVARHRTAIKRHELSRPLRIAVKDAAVIGTSLHQEGEGRKLSGTVVDLQTEKVLGQDELGDVPQAVAPFEVNLLQKVVGFHEDVARAAGWVHKREFFGIQTLRRDLLKRGQHFGRLLGRLDVELHFALERRLRVRGEPLTAKAVLDEVFDDQVGREQLRGGGDVLALDHLADHLVFLL